MKPSQKVAESGLEDARILVVDDLRSSRMMITAILKSAGFTTIEEAEDGDLALKKIQSWEPDIVILDIVMPNVDGYEVCQRVRNELNLAVPILVQSSLSQPDEKVRAFSEGASDIVSKPVDAGEMVSRVCLHLERDRLVKQLQRYQTRMETELKTAEQMQLALLKTGEEAQSIAEPYGLDIESFYQASNQLGGDLWDVFEVDENRLGLILVDLSGHGVSSAINAFRVHLLLRQLKDLAGEPAAFMAALNDKLSEILPVQQFATVFYCVWDRTNQTLRMSSAGAPYPVVLSSGGAARQLQVGGQIAGCKPGVVFEEQSVDLGPGDGIFLYSDALYEDFDAPENSLDAAQVTALGEKGAAAQPGNRLPTIMQAAFPDQSKSFRDDLTLLFVSRRA